ncbi:MAG: LysR family transcriptional regulator [Pseudomonadota bacterium]
MARLNYNHLHYFWAVATNGNLTRTAEELHVSQSALSIQIKKLEQQLGHALFHREGKRLVLTEAGRLALAHANVIFANGAELQSALRDGVGVSKVLRVGALSTLSRNFQMRFLDPLFARQQTRVVVRTGTLNYLIHELEAHRLDVILTNVVPASDATTPWHAHTIDRQAVGLIGRPDSADQDASLDRLLAEYPIIVPTRETDMRVSFDALVNRLGAKPRILAEVDDMALLRLMARQGVGLVVVPPIVVADELESGELLVIAELPGCVESFTALHLERQFPNELLRKVLEASTTLFADEDA